MSNTVDGTSKIKNGTQGNSDPLTYVAGYEFARWIHERGESRGPWRGDEIPALEKISLRSRGVDEPDPAVFWQGYCEYWYDLGIGERVDT